MKVDVFGSEGPHGWKRKVFEYPAKVNRRLNEQDIPCQINVASDGPSEIPSMIPSMIPSPVPSESSAPSSSPSRSPSAIPSDIPSELPSLNPSISVIPSSTPSKSLAPSDVPSQAPSSTPYNIDISDVVIVVGKYIKLTFSGIAPLETDFKTMVKVKGHNITRTDCNKSADGCTCKDGYLAATPHGLTKSQLISADDFCSEEEKILFQDISEAPSSSPSACNNDLEWRVGGNSTLAGMTCADIPTENLVAQTWCDKIQGLHNSTYHGKSIKEACCTCGGSKFMGIAPSSAPSSAPSKSPSPSTEDLPTSAPSPNCFDEAKQVYLHT